MFDTSLLAIKTTVITVPLRNVVVLGLKKDIYSAGPSFSSPSIKSLFLLYLYLLQ